MNFQNEIFIQKIKFKHLYDTIRHKQISYDKEFQGHCCQPRESVL